jgi:hypothetical protein
MYYFEATYDIYSSFSICWPTPNDRHLFKCKFDFLDNTSPYKFIKLEIEVKCLCLRPGFEKTEIIGIFF